MATTLLLAATTGTSWGAMLVAILMTAAGLGFIIFVHELGHFAVAKWCGVKCDKFMIGFDIGGYKIGRQWGETYYGIGILPLGGYVKMMGQDDDPRMTAEQIAESKAANDTLETKEIIGPSGEEIKVDARSYLAKSVPQRMAIISAGVIMNIIFAFLFAIIAFGLGVPSMPCIVGSTDPGAPAWVAGLMPGDEITRIGDIEKPWFAHLQSEVTLSASGEAVEFGIAGREEPLMINPSRKRRKIAQIGIAVPISLKVYEKVAAFPFSPTVELGEKIPLGATVVEVAGKPIKTHAEFMAAEVTQQQEPLAVTFLKGDTRTTLHLPVNHREYTGIVTQMGPITAVQVGSPAEAAGLKPGDRIVSINGRRVGLTESGELGWNPNRLGGQLTAMGAAGESVVLEVERAGSGKEKPVTESFNVPLRKATWIERSFSEKSPASAPALGIAYYLTNVIEAIVPDSPASKADLQRGDTLLSAQLFADEKYKEEYKSWKDPVKITEEQQAWAYVRENIQNIPPDSVLEIKVQRKGKKEPVTVKVAIATDTTQFDPSRGLLLAPIIKARIGENFGEQCSMAWYETKRSLLSVYRFLGRLINQDIPASALGGPITIARASYSWALDGPGKLLMFLTLISANLAVVNFLPIPMLDGGHMVFLIYEGIFRRPANEKFVMVMHLTGLAMILTLMVWVFGLDLGFIQRNL